MADSKRGGRSNDDEYDENDVLNSADETDDADLDADDDDAERGDVRSRSRDSRSAAQARSSRAARGTTKAKERDRSRRGIVGRVDKFIREVVAELQKVIYPTRKELLTYTSVVLVFVVVVMTIVSLLDVGFAQLMALVFGDTTTT